MAGRGVLQVGCWVLLLASIVQAQATQPAAGKQALIKVSVLKITRDATPADSRGMTLVAPMDQQTSDLLSQLETQGKVEVLSRPYVLASNDERATIGLGPSEPVAINAPSPATQPAGPALAEGQWSLKLEFVPHIHADGSIDMELSSHFSDAYTPAEVQPRPATPFISTASAKTSLLTRSGQSILICANRRQQGAAVSEVLVIVTPSVPANADARN